MVLVTLTGFPASVTCYMLDAAAIMAIIGIENRIFRTLTLLAPFWDSCSELRAKTARRT